MKELNELDADSILDDEVFIELYEIEDPIERSKRKVQLGRRAKVLGVKSDFDEMIKGYNQADREMKRQEKETRAVCSLDNFTNFSGKYDNMFCGGWIANDTGIYAQTSGGIEEVACYHPILPVERLKNLETGEEQIKLAYKRNGRWNEIVVPKIMITSASKIVALSGRGIAVTSENAKLLVKYLADVENGNDDYIDVQCSTSKLGWIENEFIPYDTDIIFDGDSRFKQTFESVSERGNYKIWLAHVKELRKSGRIEVKFLLAASFASVLVHILGGLPFFVDLWGETEGGKTVSLMVAASVWANPDESRYIGDFKTTDVALEAKADMLNHLPMFLDDTSKTSARIRDNFEGIVYDLCSGKGKSRSNKDLGINRENRWRNVMICNGERPLSSYVNQGGAINRILEVECGEKVYENPQRTADIVKKNYGFAGKRFIEIIRNLGVDHIREIQAEFQKKLFDTGKMQKQSLSLAIVLTADKIATEYIFEDGQYISIEDAKKVLIDRNELSDNERCYHFIQDKVAMNNQRFDTVTNCEKWGVIDNGYAIFYNSAFDQICRDGGFSKKSFLSWADKKCLIQTQGGQQTKVKKINGTAARCVWLKIDESMDNDGFKPVDEGQEELPFK
nr:MAG TPA: active helicase ring shaped helicase [Caudoviricetes sp.]